MSSAVKKNRQDIGKYKVYIPGGYGAGESFPHQIIGQPINGGNNSVCSQSYIYVALDSFTECENFIKYLKTKFFRALVLSLKITQSAPNKVYRFVPLLNFSTNSDIQWSLSIKEINKRLYEKFDLVHEEIEFIEKMIKEMN